MPSPWTQEAAATSVAVLPLQYAPLPVNWLSERPPHAKLPWVGPFTCWFLV